MRECGGGLWWYRSALLRQLVFGVLVGLLVSFAAVAALRASGALAGAGASTAWQPCDWWPKAVRANQDAC